jgi:predicted acylesterase/phospholipase RssA/CRP-like cAMP-binding protein
VTTSTLLESGDSWLLQYGLQANLTEEERNALLGASTWREYQASTVIIPLGVPAPGVDLIVNGEVSIHLPGEQIGTFRLGPGHVLGERSVLRQLPTSAEVRAVSDVRTLHVRAEVMGEVLAASPGVREFFEDLVQLRERIDTLVEQMLDNPVLRSLGRGDLVRFVQAGTLRRLEARERLVSAGDADADVYVLLSGRLNIFAPADKNGRRERLGQQGPGWFFGHAAALLKTPRTADIDAIGAVEVLQVSEETFRDIVARNPALQRRLLSELATLDLRVADVVQFEKDAFVIGVCALHHDHDATTITYGIAAEERLSCEVAVLDMSGTRTAKRLRIPVVDGELYGVPIRRFTPGHPLGHDVFWPIDRARVAELADAFEHANPYTTTLLINAAQPTPDELASLESLDSLVLVRDTSDEFRALPARRGQRRVEVVRLRPDSTTPIPARPGIVRLLHDPSSVAAFWSRADTGPLVSRQTITGRASGRIVRALRGRTVGLALGGGGALGYAHIGLIKALEDNNVPIDIIAGASFGSIVGGSYAAGGHEALDILVRRSKTVGALALASLVTLEPFTQWLRRGITHGTHLGATEIPFMPVCLDVTTGREFVPIHGTVAQGIRASAAMPGVFPSVANRPGRLVDGGMINNVPTSVVWDAGANFIIGSNVIPSVPSRRTGMGMPRPARALYQRTLGRVDDLLHSLYMMMARVGRDRASQADYLFDLGAEQFSLNEFHRGAEIRDVGLAQARNEVERILEAYSRDRLTGVGGD